MWLKIFLIIFLVSLQRNGCHSNIFLSVSHTLGVLFACLLLLLFLWFWFFFRQNLSLAQGSLELKAIFLPWPRECWTYRHKWPHVADSFFFLDLHLTCSICPTLLAPSCAQRDPLLPLCPAFSVPPSPFALFPLFLLTHSPLSKLWYPPHVCIWTYLDLDFAYKKTGLSWIWQMSLNRVISISVHLFVWMLYVHHISVPMWDYLKMFSFGWFYSCLGSKSHQSMAVPSLWKQMMHRNISFLNIGIKDWKHFSKGLAELSLGPLDYFG
jgi:hypothetical protein